MCAPVLEGLYIVGGDVVVLEGFFEEGVVVGEGNEWAVGIGKGLGGGWEPVAKDGEYAGNPTADCFEGIYYFEAATAGADEVFDDEYPFVAA